MPFLCLGLQEMCFVIGNDAGATLWGTLFYHIGTRNALITFSLFTGFLLASLILYTTFSKAIEYEKLPEHDDHDDHYFDDDC